MFSHQMSSFTSSLNSAITNKKLYIDVEFYYLNLEILKILRDNGCIKSFFVSDNKIRIFFRYINNNSILKKIFVISKPSKKVYWKVDNVYLNLFNLKLNGFYIISTSFGLYTTSEILFLNKFISGEILLFVKI